MLDTGLTEPPGSVAPAAAVPDVLLQHRRRTRRRVAVVAGLVLAVVALALVGLVVGASSATPAQGWAALWRGLTTRDPDDALLDHIVWQLRVPRVLMAVVGGMALALAGLMMQTILRNPLASPYTLGVSSSAAFGAALAIVMRTSVLALGVTLPYNYLVVTNAFVFALLSMAGVYALTTVQRVTPETIVLLGVAMMYLFSALTSLVQYLGDPDQLAELTYWMFGSLNESTWTMLTVTTAVTLVGVLAAWRWSWDLNALTADDESASTSGINVRRVRLKTMVVASLLTATVVAFAGPIGFVGLVAPHLARMLVGGDHRFLTPVSLMTGALLLLGADTIARTVVAPVVIPVGIITAFVGVPVLVTLMLRRRREFW